MHIAVLDDNNLVSAGGKFISLWNLTSFKVNNNLFNQRETLELT